MFQPRISVIIPTYNRAGDIEGAVASVLEQTLPASEILIVDDGSEDDTQAVVAALSGPVRSFRQTNAGASVARNRGLREATGDFIAFLDVDDRWHPTKLAVQMAALGRSPKLGWSATDIEAVDLSGNPRPGHRGVEDSIPLFGDLRYSFEEWLTTRLERGELFMAEKKHVIYSGDIFSLLLHGNFIYPSTALIRKDVAEAVGPFDPRFPTAEDNDYFLRMADASPASIVTTPLVRYRTGSPDAATHRSNSDKLIETALECLRLAVERRYPLSSLEEEAYRTGRALLHRRRAWLELTNLQQETAKRALHKLRSEGHPFNTRDLGLWVLASLPRPILEGMGWMKRRLKG